MKCHFDHDIAPPCHMLLHLHNAIFTYLPSSLCDPITNVRSSETPQVELGGPIETVYVHNSGFTCKRLTIGTWLAGQRAAQGHYRLERDDLPHGVDSVRIKESDRIIKN